PALHLALHGRGRTRLHAGRHHRQGPGGGRRHETGAGVRTRRHRHGRTRARRGRRGRRRETACRGGGHRGRGHGPEFGAAVGRRRTAPAAGASRRRVRGGSGDGGRGHRTRSRSGLPASDRQHTARLTTGVSVASKLGPLAVIVGHELRSRLRDGTALLVAFVAPVVLATLFGV